MDGDEVDASGEFILIPARAIGLTSCFVYRVRTRPSEIKRRAEIAEYWEEKARRGEGIGEESRGKLNERGNLETY